MKDEDLDHLFEAARHHEVDTSSLEFGFETRLLARIRALEVTIPWYTLAWRFVPLFGAIVLALAVWSVTEPGITADLFDLLVRSLDAPVIESFLAGGL